MFRRQLQRGEERVRERLDRIDEGWSEREKIDHDRIDSTKKKMRKRSFTSTALMEEFDHVWLAEGTTLPVSGFIQRDD